MFCSSREYYSLSLAGSNIELSSSWISDFVGLDISLIWPHPNYTSLGFASEILE